MAAAVRAQLGKLRDVARTEPPGRVAAAAAFGCWGGLFPIPGATTGAVLGLCGIARMGAVLTGASLAINFLLTPLQLGLVYSWCMVGAAATGAELPESSVLIPMLTQNTTQALGTFGAAIAAGCGAWAVIGLAAVPLLWAVLWLPLTALQGRGGPLAEIEPRELLFPTPLTQVVTHRLTVRCGGGKAVLFKFRTRDRSRRRYRVSVGREGFEAAHYGIVLPGSHETVTVKYLPRPPPDTETPESIGHGEGFQVEVRPADSRAVPLAKGKDAAALQRHIKEALARPAAKGERRELLAVRCQFGDPGDVPEQLSDAEFQSPAGSPRPGWQS